ncbi:MAG TPA: hypothetical protein PKE45_00040 [Caldilineaceae bacterium]|nr:hypothetical protein [Caldilineaceae bacterium]
MVILALVLIALGVVVLMIGARLAILGAGVGALLGIGLLRLLQVPLDNLIWWFIVPGALAVLCALGGGFMKGVIDLVTLALGVLAGGAVMLALPDLFGFLSFGIPNWLLALVGGVIGVIVIGRFKDWGMMIIAALVGAMLTMRGLQLLFPSFQGPLASLLALALVGGGIAYQMGWIGGGGKQATQA